jgi:hypothetical protein
MNLESGIPRDFYPAETEKRLVNDQCEASAMNTAALTDSLAVCCFREDCPIKGLESAVVAEAIHRLQHPLSWRLRLWWRHWRPKLHWSVVREHRTHSQDMQTQFNAVEH